MRSSTIVGVTLVIGVLVASGLHAQSLGDVARKEEARRKGVKAPAKVYTNDNLKNVDPPAAPAAPPTPAPDTAATGATPAAPAAVDASASPATPDATAAAVKQPVRDEKYWRGRLEAARTALSRAQIFQDALQSRINALSTDFVNRDDPAQRSVIAAERQKALAELERVKKEIVDQQKAITDIQEEGRRAGVLPGWLR
jgi:hypothetical protein